jgi:hypothetical protein
VPIVRLRREDQLYFGTDSLRDTLDSLVAGSLYGEWSARVGSGVELVTVMLLGAAFVISVMRAARSTPPPPSALLALLVVLPLLIATVQHELFDTPYPLGRTALYLVPLAAMWICTVADELHVAGDDRVRRVVSGVAGALTLLVAVNLATSLNLSSTYEWSYDADTERIAEDLDEVVANDPRARIGTTWLLEPTLNFYRLTKNLRLAELTDDCRGDCLLESYDWYVAVDADPGLVPGQDGGAPTERYPTSGAVLLRTGSATGER